MPNPYAYPAHPLMESPAFARPFARPSARPSPESALRGLLVVAAAPVRSAGRPLATEWPEVSAARRPGAGPGVVLCDETGQLFERIGDYVRPLGPLSPLAHRLSRHAAPAPARPAFEMRPRPGPALPEVPPGGGEVPEASAPGEPVAARLRPLLAEPGRSCVVRFGDFKPLLAPRLDHPERLRDSHRLACHAQVYEPTAPLRLGSGTDRGPLCPLTHALASRLGLADFVGEALPRAIRPAPDVAVPGERLLLLKPVDDPTVDAPPPPSGPMPSRPFAPRVEVGASAAKTAIPDRFLRPWEMNLGREEALDAIDRDRGLLRSLVASLGRWTRRRGIRRWQVRLSGHSADEQLWGIEPPGLLSPFVRDWARHTLRLAGYDSGTMLLEWELFWRRKGVRA